MSVPLNESLVVPDNILFRELDGEAVILNLNNETYYGLDSVGTRMWQNLTTQSSFTAAYNNILAEYDVPPSVLRQDMEELAAQLLDQGLLELG